MIHRFSAPAQTLCPLADLWFARCADGTVPARAAFTPEDMRPWMGWIAIFQAVERMPLRLRVRLYGTHLAAQAGYDLTGKVLPDGAPDDCQPFLPGMAQALETRLPVYESIDAPGVLRYARLVLPVASNGAVPDTLITSTDVSDLRSGARDGIGLTRAIAGLAGQMQRQVLPRPDLAAGPGAAPAVPDQGPDASA